MEAALLGAVRAMAHDAGVSLADVGGRTYAPTCCDPWPEVDLSGVTADPGRQIELCIDGSGPEATSGRAAA